MLVKILTKCFLRVSENGALAPRLCNPGEEVSIPAVIPQDVEAGLYVPMSAGLSNVKPELVQPVIQQEPKDLPVVDLEDNPQIIQPVKAEEFTDGMINNHFDHVRSILETTITEYDEKGRVERGIRSMDRMRRHIPVFANGGANFKVEGEEAVQRQPEILSSSGMPITVVKKDNGDIDVAKTLGFKVVGGL